MTETQTVQIRDIVVGDFVDLENDQYLGKTDENGMKVHAQVEFEHCEVLEIEQESDNCIVLYFEGMAAGYDPGQTMTIKRRADTA